MNQAVRIVFEEDGFPRELLTAADRARAVRDDSITPATMVTVYRDTEHPFVAEARSLPELRPLFGIDEPVDEDETTLDPVAGNAAPTAVPPVRLADGSSAPFAMVPSVRAIEPRDLIPSGPTPSSSLRASSPEMRPHARPASPKSAIEWAIRPLFFYADFQGRAPVREFFGFALVVFLAAFIGTLMFKGVGGALILLGLVVPALAVTVRRLHDLNLSGWLILVGLVPYLGLLFLTVALLVPAGTDPNKYGFSPFRPRF